MIYINTKHAIVELTQTSLQYRHLVMLHCNCKSNAIVHNLWTIGDLHPAELGLMAGRQTKFCHGLKFAKLAVHLNTRFLV